MVKDKENGSQIRSASHFIVVEMRGIEPLSESQSKQLSPGAAGQLHSLS